MIEASSNTALEKALAESELRLRQVIDAMPHMVWMATLDGNCDFLSKRWEEYTGIAAEAQLGNGWTQQLHVDDRKMVQAGWQKAVATGMDFQFNCRIRRYDGAYRWFETRGLPLRNAQGRIVKWFGTNTDIHEAYETREALAANEGRLHYVTLATHDCVYDWDMPSGNTYRNEEFQIVFGAPPKTRSSDRWWENRIHPDDRKRVVDSAALAFSAHAPKWSAEYRLRRADGGYAIVNDRAYLLYRANGKPLRMIGAIADITERKQVEQSLRDAQARLLSALEGAAMATWIWDIEANRLYWDEAAYRLWGRRSDEIGELSLLDTLRFIHNDDRPGIEAAIQEFFRTGVDKIVEFRTIRPDGKLQWLQVRGRIERDSTGKPLRMAGVYIDVTERKEVEQTLRDSQARLVSAMQAGGLGTWIWDIRANEMLWDEATCRLWGQPPKMLERFALPKLRELIHPDDLERLIESTAEFRRTGVDTVVEFRTKRPDGALQWLLSKGQIERDGSGQVIRMAGVYVDITERKQAEQLLRDSQARLVSAMEGGGLATWIWDITSDVLQWDDAAYRLWGRRPGEFAAISAGTVISLMHPEDGARVAQAGEAFYRTGVDTPVEFRTMRPDGAVQWLLAKGQIQRDESGQPIRMAGVYVDITDRKRAEEAQLRTQKMEALGTLAGGIAHDFNNILLAISGNAKLAIEDLRNALPPGHPVHRNLLEIDKASARAADLVRRILTFSRQQDSQHSAVQLQPLIEDALRLLRPTLPAIIEINTAYADNVEPVSTDAIQIHQVVMNLVTNASHAIGDRRGVIQVILQGRTIGADPASDPEDLPPGRYTCLSVSDTGAGIDKAIIDRIFDPFFTTKKAGQGTGLGLAVVHGIVKAHGGAIVIDSEAGKGTTFHLYFPVTNAQPASMAIEAPRARHSEGEHVLYVDDEEPLVFLIARVLERLGYRVTGCVDPELALKELQAHPDTFDVLVTDLSMRGMNGFELTREAHKIRRDLPVVLTSGYLRTEDRETAQQVGIREMILKPNTVEELGQALDRTLIEIRSQISR